MASGGKVEIQVELEGGGKVQRALNKVGKGATLAGNQVAQAGEAISTSGHIMTSSMGRVVSSVGVLTEGIGTLTIASRTAGTSFTALLGPIAAIGAAIFGVVQAVRQYIKNTEDLRARMEAIRAAAAEYTSITERLAAEQVHLTDVEREELRVATERAQVAVEYLELIRQGEGVRGQRLKRRHQEVQQIAGEIQKIRERTQTEAYFLHQTIGLRARLKVATQILREEQALLNDEERETERLLREKEALFERLMQKGKTARQKATQEAAKAAQDAVAALQTIQNMQLRFNMEAISAAGVSVSQRVAFLRVELEERRKIINQSIADEQERLTAIAAAEQAFNAKRRALYKQNRAQRDAARAQEAAAEQAAADKAFADEQRRAQALIMLQSKGIEQQRQLIELRFAAAQRASTNEIQMETARFNRQRDLMALEQKQEADRRAAEMQRIDALQRSIELTRQEAEALQMLANAPLDKVTAAVENFGQGLVFASLAALQSGESVSVAVGEALKAIALQAGVEAIMQTAKGTAALFTPGGQKVASGHFQAAAFFGAAAVAAGAAGSALSASGGGGGVGASPTGAAQSIRDRDFDRDEERGGVTINVNMGQAVIYDTKAAAERAFADRVVQAINTPRRGAVRLRGA